MIAAATPIPHPIKMFFCDETVLFGFAGSVIIF
jgi:hypothetical protein